MTQSPQHPNTPRAPIVMPLARVGRPPGYSTIYVERELFDHPRAKKIMARFAKASVITIERHSEIFNPGQQNFRLQKRNPSLILARKHGPLVHRAPAGYGIGGAENFYFSHMLNCPYDCRYCFLQGMFNSAHHSLFVNYEDFVTAVGEAAGRVDDQPAWFFSGYDCDSLAMDDLTGFAEHFIPALDAMPNAHLELRTKSAQTRSLLRLEAHPRVVVAFSMSPETIVDALEHGTARLTARIAAAQRLAAAGWKIGLRFDPLVHHDQWRASYQHCIDQIAAALTPSCIHSISVGPMRFPKAMFTKVRRLYPNEAMLADEFTARGSMVSYPSQVERDMMGFVHDRLDRSFPDVPRFACLPEPAESESDSGGAD